MQANAPSPGPMTADQVAEDFLGQIHELLREGAPFVAVVRALEAEGLQADTAGALLHDISGLQVPDSESVPASDLVCGIDVDPVRRLLRQVVKTPGQLPPATQLRDALRRQGLQDSTADKIVGEIVYLLKRLDDIRSSRLRRTGAQGMVAGSLFAAYFLWAATRPGHDGRGDAVTTALCLGLAVYSTILFLRHKPG